MSDYTTNYGLIKVGAGDSLSDGDYQFGTTDRDRIDSFFRTLEAHRHTGGSVGDFSPGDAPNLELFSTGGLLPSGLTLYYVFTLVDENGVESTRSPEASISTPAAVADPPAATLSSVSTGGTLIPGNYYYALSAYVGSTATETKAPNSAYILLSGTLTNVITVELPSLPSGADGFNVYRRAPGQNKYFFVDSIDMDVATPPTEWDDDGSVAPDCDRTLPSSNTTNSTNMVTITYPGATPDVPVGYTWKIYRTYFGTGDTRWKNSLLHHVVETLYSLIAVDYDDTGFGTSTGTPPTSFAALDPPLPVDLEDGLEVQNRLPVGNVTAFPQVVHFAFQGLLTPTVGTIPWMCEFPRAWIVDSRAVLGVDSSPSAVDVIVDVNKWDSAAATPTLSTIYTTQANRPKVLVGEQIGTPSVPDIQELVRGDYLTVDVDQAGGGATPLDYDLIVNVTLLVQFDAATSDETLWS